MIRGRLASRRLGALRCVPLALALQLSLPHAASAADSELAFIGTRGLNSATPSAILSIKPAGIYAVRLNAVSGELMLIGSVAALNRAQWLSVHPRLPVLYAVAQGAGGADADSDLYSFAINPATGQLTPLNRVDAGGRDATHLFVDADSATLFSANHGSGTDSTPPLFAGTVSDLAIQPDGSLGPLVASLPESGSGPNPARQRNAQVHGVALAPGGHFVLTADLGADRIFIYHFDRHTRALWLAGSETLPPGSGPRHLLFSGSGKFLYLNTELTARVHVFAWDQRHGQLRALQTLEGYPADYSGTSERSSADLALSPDGRFLYLSLRGDQNTLVVYAVDRRHGTLRELQRIGYGGQGSRGFAIDPSGRWLLVVNDNDSLTELARDAVSGRLTLSEHTLPIPKPATVTFYAR